jgi:hypothetical protein
MQDSTDIIDAISPKANHRVNTQIVDPDSREGQMNLCGYGFGIRALGLKHNDEYRSAASFFSIQKYFLCTDISDLTLLDTTIGRRTVWM